MSEFADDTFHGRLGAVHFWVVIQSIRQPRCGLSHALLDLPSLLPVGSVASWRCFPMKTPMTWINMISFITMLQPSVLQLLGFLCHQNMPIL
jgi:hypothetical protein